MAYEEPGPPATAAARRRARPGTKKLIEFKDGRVRRRLQVYLPLDVAEELEEHHRSGRKMSRIIELALRAYLPTVRD